METQIAKKTLEKLSQQFKCGPECLGQAYEAIEALTETFDSTDIQNIDSILHGIKMLMVTEIGQSFEQEKDGTEILIASLEEFLSKMEKLVNKISIEHQSALSNIIEETRENIKEWK